MSKPNPTIEVTPLEIKALVVYHCGQAKKAQNRLGKMLTEERAKMFPSVGAMKILIDHAKEIVSGHINRARELGDIIMKQ